MVYSKAMPTDLEKLARFLGTKTAKTDLLDQIDLLSTELLTRMPYAVKDLAKNYSDTYGALTALNYESDTQVDQTTLDKLRGLADELEEVLITIPARTEGNPSICEWVLENVSPTAVVKYDKEDANLTDGVKMAYHGWYKDYSLEKLIKEKLYV
jgi:hypothetical protein